MSEIPRRGRHVASDFPALGSFEIVDLECWKIFVSGLSSYSGHCQCLSFNCDQFFFP